MPNPSLTILIADDDLEDLELIEEALTKQDSSLKIDKVTTGLAVIEYLNNSRPGELPCLIILDYNMPELTGAQVLKSICKEPRYGAIPKIILSTSNTSAFIRECMNNGATDYLIKPDNIKDFDALAEKLLALCKKTTYSDFGR